MLSVVSNPVGWSLLTTIASIGLDSDFISFMFNYVDTEEWLAKSAQIRSRVYAQ
jgi:hypothetical protein